MKKLEYLIVKYFENNLNIEEREHLIKLLEDDKNKAYFREYVRLNHLINSKTEFNQEKYFNLFKTKINKRFRYKNIYKYAAAILIFVSAGYFFLTKDNAQITEPTIVNNNIETGTDKATLTLEDGTDITLEKGQQYISDNLESNGEKIVYQVRKPKKTEVAYNYLTIPRGGQYHVKLSDGTEVWLNSESQLKYPVNFKEGAPREVELVYGEAYFDVSASTNHNGSKFKVQTEIQVVEVLGTEFNVKAYKDEDAIYTTLVEGKVSISNSALIENLSPGQQSNVNLTNHSMFISTVDVYNAISWKNGVFSFENMPLKNIMKVLSRWYDTDVVYIDSKIENKLFTGILDKEQSIEEILSIIHNLNGINYEINNKTILLR